MVKLTKRELEVLVLLKQKNAETGKRNKPADVADALYTSVRTVNFHLANIYDKLKVNTREDAFDALAELGLTLPSDVSEVTEGVTA